MTAYLHDNVFDNGLSAVKSGAVGIYITKTQQPTNYTEATSTYAVGHKTTAAGSIFPGAISAGATSGRKITTLNVTDGVVDGAGTNTAGWYGIVDASVLLVANTLSSSQSVTNGNTFTLGPFDVTLRGTT